MDDGDYPLCGYGIDNSTNTSDELVEYRLILHEKQTGIPQTYFLDETHYDARWNCSYEGICTGNPKRPQKEYLRGGKRYFKPVGCVRYGVKVVGKYENDEWLGGKGLRPETEWPVAYHGTKELNVLEILRKGFLLEKGVRFAYGKGIYCTPTPYTALQYAHNYGFNGKQYKLIIQCRVDPQKLQIVASHAGGHGDYWLVPNGEAIRAIGGTGQLTNNTYSHTTSTFTPIPLQPIKTTTTKKTQNSSKNIEQKVPQLPLQTVQQMQNNSMNSVQQQVQQQFNAQLINNATTIQPQSVQNIQQMPTSSNPIQQQVQQQFNALFNQTAPNLLATATQMNMNTQSGLYNTSGGTAAFSAALPFAQSLLQQQVNSTLQMQNLFFHQIHNQFMQQQQQSISSNSDQQVPIVDNNANANTGESDKTIELPIPPKQNE